jgi:hypothetical protein
MASTPKFKIGFGKVARTLVCEDDIGTICFTFDISPAGNHAKENWKLQLDPRPLGLQAESFEYMSVADNDRAAAAFEQAKAYAASKGYLVEPP